MCASVCAEETKRTQVPFSWFRRDGEGSTKLIRTFTLTKVKIPGEANDAMTDKDGWRWLKEGRYESVG